jgi:hypothetical protein
MIRNIVLLFFTNERRCQEKNSQKNTKKVKKTLDKRVEMCDTINIVEIETTGETLD